MYRIQSIFPSILSTYLTIHCTLTQIQQTHALTSIKSYFSTCIPGVEAALADELQQENINAANVRYRANQGGVSFTERDENSMEVGLRALMWSRVSHRIMERLNYADDEDETSVVVRDREELYNFIYETVDVNDVFFGDFQKIGSESDDLPTLSCRCVIRGGVGYIPKDLTHSHYNALTVKNAIVDKCRDLCPDGLQLRPNVNVDDPDVPFLLSLKGVGDQEAEVILYRCLNGNGSLHKRGYRHNLPVHKAAMKETMASALLIISGWHKLVEAAKKDGKEAVLVDPMMGSGTFCIEGGLIAADIAPGLLRMKNDENLPAVLRWNSSKGSHRLWTQICREAMAKRRNGLKWLHDKQNCLIVGNEMVIEAHQLANEASKQADLRGDNFHLRQGNCRDFTFNDEDFSLAPGRTIVVTNPPWGLRLTDDVQKSWEDFSYFLNKECGGTEGIFIFHFNLCIR